MPQGEGTYGSQVGRPTKTPKKQRSGFKMNGMGFGQGTGRQAIGGIPPRGAVPMQGRVTPGARPPFMQEGEDKNLKEKIKRLQSSIDTEKDWKIKVELKKSLNELKDKLYGSDRG